MPITARPAPGDYAPYFAPYLALVPEGDLLGVLAETNRNTRELIGLLDEAGGDRRYAQGKWSVKEIILHLIDCERVFAYRALCFARGDAGELPGFDHEVFAAASGAGARTLADLADEFAAVRAASIALLRGLDAPALAAAGTASANRVTVLALGCLIAGHELHHVGVIREKYLTA